MESSFAMRMVKETQIRFRMHDENCFASFDYEPELPSMPTLLSNSEAPAPTRLSWKIHASHHQHAPRTLMPSSYLCCRTCLRTILTSYVLFTLSREANGSIAGVTIQVTDSILPTTFFVLLRWCFENVKLEI